MQENFRDVGIVHAEDDDDQRSQVRSLLEQNGLLTDDDYEGYITLEALLLELTDPDNPLRPRILIIDNSFRQGGGERRGYESIPELRELLPDAAIFLFTEARQDRLDEMRDSGWGRMFTGIYSKHSPNDLIEAVREVMTGWESSDDVLLTGDE